MPRIKKHTIDELLKTAQDKYLKARKRCDELAKEIDRLSNLRQEEIVRKLME